MVQATVASSLAGQVLDVLARFQKWLDSFGETSWDHQSFFAGPIGGRAKSLYYRNRGLGTAAVAPMILFEAALPHVRRLFHHAVRFPIADAHYAMGFAFLYEATRNPAYLEKSIHFLDVLTKSRCSSFAEYCWGYPFDWVTRNGIIKTQTPLITTTPYCYEAFLQVGELLESKVRGQMSEARCQSSETTGQALRTGQGVPQLSTFNSQLDDCRAITASIARHAANDIKDFKTSKTASSCSYTPDDEGGVINAAAYRAFLLTSASQVFLNDAYWCIAERNLNFVLENQNADGSWFYAVDGVRDFVDHYHTCFVMKALAKIHALADHEATLKALGKGVGYYLNNLFDADSLPKPFSRAPRLTVYKRELYDYAECINLCLLLRDRFPVLDGTLQNVVTHILKAWVKCDGSFRSRKLHLGWDNVPMHRWGQSQMFRALAFYLRETPKAEKQKPETLKAEPVFSSLSVNSQPSTINSL